MRGRDGTDYKVMKLEALFHHLQDETADCP